MEIAGYVAQDFEGCLGLFDSNVPEFFLPTEREELADFLADPPGIYLVMRDGPSIVACGGIARRADDAVLCWGMVRSALHGRGFGRALLQARLALARAWDPRPRAVTIETSQRSEGFFTRAGFVADTRTTDGFGPGLDSVRMSLGL